MVVLFANFKPNEHDVVDGCSRKKQDTDRIFRDALLRFRYLYYFPIEKHGF